MNIRKYSIPIFLILIGSLGGALAIDFIRTIPHNGRVKAIGVRVYDDVACTIETVSIDWGDVEPLAVYYITKYIKNTQSIDVTLAIAGINWNPLEAGTYITVGWDYITGTILEPTNVIPVEINLEVAGTVEGIEEWTGDIAITATEAGI